MQVLRKGTAATIMFGPFVDKADGVTLKADDTAITDIDHATTGIFLSKAGGTAAVRHQGVTASAHDAYGMMQVTLDTTDTNTVGQLDVLFAKAATYLPVHKSFMVMNETLFDSLYSATAGAIPNVVAGASTGLLINGSNTGAVTLNGLTTGALATSTITTTGNLAISGTLAVGGASTFKAVTTEAFTTGAFTPSSISVSGTTTLSGAVSFGSTFGVTGAVTYNSFACSNGMTVTGASGLSVSTLVSTGVVTLASVGVSGTTTLTGAVAATNAGNDIKGITVGAIGNNVITAASINASALDSKGNWNVGKTGYALTQAFPTNFSAMTIEAVTGIVDSNVQKINDVTITGNGQAGTEFGV